MSVPEGKRTESQMSVFVKAHELAVHTAVVLANKKIFNPEIDETLINRIRGCGYDILAKALTANRIRADTNSINWQMRYRLQQETISLCDEMYAYINIAKKIYHVRNKKIVYWLKILSDTRALLQRWKENDIRRYGRP